jgi:hypothetical protein
MLGFYNYCTKFQTIRFSLSQGCIQQGFSSGVLGEQPSVSLLFFRGGWVGGWEIIQMNWLPNDLSAEGASSLGGPVICPRKILKIRTLEMPFPAIWALNYELQFDFKKGKTLEFVPYF